MQLLKIINEDLDKTGKKSFPRKVLTFLFNPSFGLLFNYRIGHYFVNNRNFIYTLLILYLRKRQIAKYGCDIAYQAKIGRRVSFPHPIGIVIGVHAVIENDVMIWQNVTLGSKGHIDKVYPHIKSNVKIYSAAQIIGGVTIGEGAKIGAFSLVLNDIPANSVAVGIPAKVI
jgi:serine O-acetyltransferase